MLRLLIVAALVAPLVGCGRRESAAPAALVPDVTLADPADEAKEAAYRTHFDAGTKALAAGDADAAITHFKLALSEDAAAADAHFQLGRALVAKKDDAEALKSLSEAVRLNPRLAEAYLERAAIHDRAGRLADAGYDYYRVIDLDGDRKTLARAYWLRSSVYDRQGKRDNFRYDREKAIALDPAYAPLVTSGDVRVFNHTDAKLKIAFEQFVNPDGSNRTFPPGFAFTIPDDTTRYLLDDSDRHMPARSVRFTLTTGNGSKTFAKAYDKGLTLEIHIYQADLPERR